MLPSTQTKELPADRSEPRWWLVVGHHPARALVGRRWLVDGELVLGREQPLCEASGDLKLSRAHAKVAESSRGQSLELEDLGSRNGTTVNGLRVMGAQDLAAGMVVGLGSLLLIPQRAPLDPLVQPHPRIAHASYSIACALRELELATHRLRPLLLVGETGVGKGLMAEEAHILSARTGPFVQLTCAQGIPALPDARGGSLYLDGLEDLPALAQAALVRAIDDLDDVLLIASCAASPEALVARSQLRADLANRFSGWVLELPPLRERREDIAAITAHFASKVAPDAALDLDLAAALLAHDYPGNVRELLNILERASIDSAWKLTPRLRALLTRSAPADAAAGARAPQPSNGPEAMGAPDKRVRIARNGEFFELGGHRTSIATRKSLKAVLSALVAQSSNNAQTSLPVSALVALGWPGERVLPRAGASRVYVAITTLRQLGLDPFIERTPAGYRLDPTQPIVLVD